MPIVPITQPHHCPARCGKSFATIQGLNCHLGTATSCRWYKKGKLRELGTAVASDNPGNDSETRSSDEENKDMDEDEDPEDVVEDLQHELFQLIPFALGELLGTTTIDTVQIANTYRY